MTFSLKKIVKKSTRILSAFLIAMVLSGVTVHTYQPNTWSKHATSVITTQITSVTYAGGPSVVTKTSFPTETLEPITPKGTATTNDSDAFITGTVKLLNTLLMLMYAILIPLISFAGWLLSPDWVLGDVLNLRPVLHNLWVLISNIVYVIFAFILIAMAFMNIFGSGNKAYELKSALPKLIVGIIMVPITWFIVSGTLSVTSILTASVLQLPSRVIQDTQGSSYLDNIYVPNAVYINLTGSGNYGNGTVDSNGDKKAIADDTLDYKANGFMYSLDCSNRIQSEVDGDNNDVADGDKCVSLKSMLDGQWAYSILFAYAYGIFNIQNFQTLTDAEIGTVIKNVWDLAIKLMFGVAVFLAFWFMVIALVVALITRAVHLWIYAVFSPVFALWHFYDGKVPGLDKMKTVKLTIGEFFGLAMVPVVVSAGLAFWLMILSFTMNATIDNARWSTGNMETDANSWQSTFNIGWFKLISVGNINPTATDTGVTNKVNGIVSSLPGAGKSLIGKIIINVFALILLWMIVQAALSTSDITKKVVEPIFKFGETLAKSAPILPGGMSIGATQAAARIPQQTLETKITDQLRSSWLQQSANKLFWVDAVNADVMKNELRRIVWTDGKFNKSDEIRDAAALVDKAAKQYWTQSAQYNEMAMMYAKALKEAPGDAKSWVSDKFWSIWEMIKSDKTLNLENVWAAVALWLWVTNVNEAKLYHWQNIAGWWAKSNDKPAEKKEDKPKVNTWLSAPKDATTTQVINVEIKGVSKSIDLAKDTIIKNWTIELKGDDKKHLKEIIDWLSDSDAEAILKQLFEKTWVNISDLLKKIK